MDIVVTAPSRLATQGTLSFGDIQIPCALGRSGMTHDKREGDGATPIARMPIRGLRIRSDRIPIPFETRLPTIRTNPSDGWCDDPASPRYNRPVEIPFVPSHERMYRDDALYDLVVILGWNDAPPIAGRGSAIFMHVARPDLSPTEGCVAIEVTELRRIASRLQPGDAVVVIDPEQTDQR